MLPKRDMTASTTAVAADELLSSSSVEDLGSFPSLPLVTLPTIPATTSDTHVDVWTETLNTLPSREGGQLTAMTALGVTLAAARAAPERVSYTRQTYQVCQCTPHCTVGSQHRAFISMAAATGTSFPPFVWSDDAAVYYDELCADKPNVRIAWVDGKGKAGFATQAVKRLDTVFVGMLHHSPFFLLRG